MPVKHEERGRSTVKVLSVTQMKQQDGEWHNARGSQVCFQRILSEIKSILDSGTVHVWLFAMAWLSLCLGQSP